MSDPPSQDLTTREKLISGAVILFSLGVLTVIGLMIGGVFDSPPVVDYNIDLTPSVVVAEITDPDVPME